MARYLTRPTVVEAEQWYPGVDLPGVTVVGPGKTVELIAYVTTLERQWQYLQPGDWVVQEALPGRAHKVSPDLFPLLYDPQPGQGETVSVNATPASAD